MKADEVRLYALRGGLKKQSVCYTHFHSNKVFRGDHNEGSLNMQFYRFDGSLKSSGDTPPEKWENALAVLTSREAEEIPLPPELVPPEMPPMVNQTQFCVLKMQQKRMTGSIHIPARHQRRAIRFTFAWSGENLLLLDDGGFVSGFIERMTALVPKFADGADDFLAELLIDLIQGDPGYIQHLESRLDELEQAVLDGETSKFIGRMSVVRKELNRNNRMYAQLSEFAESLQEDASELFDISSSKRLSYFLRRAEHLRSETQMLREYATQICSEYQAQVDIVQNRVMKLLTIVTTIFMPLSLIAGWYGMNFSNMPELQWTYGYPAVIGAAVLIVAALIIWFRRRKWL